MNQRCFIRLVLLFVTLFVMMSSALLAQSDNGTVVGFVKDPSGAVVPKAKVTIRNEATGVERQTTTNESGYYVVPNLPPGLYTMTAEAAGFKKFDTTTNKLDPNSTLSIDASLTVGSATDTVEVVASAATLQTESAAVEKLVTRIANRFPRAERARSAVSGLASTRDAQRHHSRRLHVQPDQWRLCGERRAVAGYHHHCLTARPHLRTRANGTSIGVADVDSTEEVQILTADYDAEYGRASGGQIRIVTKGGSQQFHGSAYEYFRNSAMNANTWSRNQSVTTNFASPFRYNQFGFNLGGPVIIPHVIPKGKMFFFFGQEWARYRNAQTQTQEVPSLLMRQGNFSELLGPNIYYSTPKVIYDPMTCPSVGAATCVPFSGNIIPTNRLSTQRQGDSEHVSGADAWLSQRQPELDRGRRRSPKTSARKPSTPTSCPPRTTKSNSGAPLSPTSRWIRSIREPTSRPKQFNRPNQAGSVSWTHTFTPTLLNEARATVSLDDVYIPVITTAAGFNRQQFGINYPYIFPVGKDLPNKVPSVNVPNMYSLQRRPLSVAFDRPDLHGVAIR